MTKASWRDLARRSWLAALARRGSAGHGNSQTLATEAMLLSLAKQALSDDTAAPTQRAACGHVLACSHADGAAVVLLEDEHGDGTCRVAAGAGWAADAVGKRAEMPLDLDGTIVQPPTPERCAGRGWIEPPLFSSQGLCASVWVPIEVDGRAVGWLTAHARTVQELDTTKWPDLIEMAKVVGQAVRRERLLQDARRQVMRACALCDDLPAPWIAVSSSDGKLVGCGRSLAVMLGRQHSECLGRSAVELFAAPAETAALEALRRPLQSGAEVGTSFRLRHRDGSVRDCVADGVVVGDAGLVSIGAPILAWVFHEPTALKWRTQQFKTGVPGDDCIDYEWELEAERERREESLRLLAPLRQGLQGLQILFDQHLGEPGPPAPDRAVLPARGRDALIHAWHAWEAAASVLTAPVQRATDLLSALEGLVRQTADRSGKACAFECIAPLTGLPDATRLAVYRASRELLLQAIDTPGAVDVVMQVQSLPPAMVQVRLLRRPKADGSKCAAHVPVAEPALRRGLGLFGVRTLLAGVGGVLVVAPGQGDCVVAELRVPSGPAAPPSAKAWPGIGAHA